MELLYPWENKPLKIQRNIIAQIWGDLYNMNPRVLKYKRESPDDRTLEVIKDVFSTIKDNQWVLLTCNDICILQTFADVFPIVYSFTSQRYSYMLDTEKLISIIDQKNIDDGSMTDMDRIRKYPVLLWNNILANHRWSGKYTGSIANIIQERVSNKGVLISTHFYSGEPSEKLFENIFTGINELWGETVSGIIHQLSKVMIYNIAKKKEHPYVIKDL